MDCDVLVVGAGPVGLTAATELARRGLGVQVVDRLETPQRYAKAVGVQPRTLELWERSGLLGDALDELVPLRGQLVHVDGEQVARVELTLPPDVPYGFAALPQYVTERLLGEQLRRLGGTVLRPVRFAGLEQDADGVTARLVGPDGERALRARYLVGADGAHSAVRAGLGVSFDGDAFAESYMLGDVELDWSQPPGWAVRSIHRVPDGAPDVLVAVPLPGRRRYRISMLAPPELAVDRSRTGNGVAHGMESDRVPELRHLQAVVDRLGPEPTTVHTLRWSSVFRISHRLAERYRVGRVFLAGDAAHIHPPTGAQGMNTGIQDAVNLAWKLAAVVGGEAGPDLLESYHVERHAVGEEVVGRTVRHAREQVPDDPDDPSVVLQREAQLLVNYRDSPIVTGTAPDGGPRPGDRAPDCRGLRRLGVTDPVRLFSVLDHPEHALLVFVDAVEQLPELDAVADKVAASPHCTRLYPVLAAGLALDPMTLPGSALVDEAGEFAATYRTGGGDTYLVRPDGYVGEVVVRRIRTP